MPEPVVEAHGPRPVGDLERGDDPARPRARRGDDAADRLEGARRIDVHVGDDPLESAQVAKRHIPGPLSPLREAGERSDDRIDEGRVDADDLEATLEEPLAGAAGGCAELAGVLTFTELDAEARDRFVELEPRARHLVAGEGPGMEPAGPAGRRRGGSVPADPPPVIAVGEAVEDEISRAGDAEGRLRKGRCEPRGRRHPGHVGDDVGRGEGAEIAGEEMDGVKARGGEAFAEGGQFSGVVLPSDLAGAAEERAGDDD